MEEKRQQLQKLQEQLLIETKIKIGAETMLQVSEQSEKGGTISRREVELQLNAANKKIAFLTKQMEEAKSVDYSAKKNPTIGAKNETKENWVISESRFSYASVKQMDVEDVRNFHSTFQELLGVIGTTTESPHVRLDCMNSLLKLLRNVHDIEKYYNLELVVRSGRTCLVDPQKEMRANAFRFLRHFVISESFIKIMFEYHIEIFLVRSLTRDHRYDVEREQAFRLIRSVLDIPGGSEYLPQSVVRALIAIAEQPDDKFKVICIETIAEIAIYNTEIIALCGGFKVLMNGIVDGPRELAEAITYALIYIIDNEENRCYVRPNVELEVIISCFTDAYGKGTPFEEKLVSSARAISILLKSWTGLIYFCANNQKALKSIIESLRLPSLVTKRVIIDMLFDIFSIEMPKWYPDFVSARNKTAQSYRNVDELSSYAQHVLVNLFPSKRRMSLLDQYQTILLLLFVEAGVTEALIDVAQSQDSNIATRATILIGELKELCNHLLPSSIVFKMNSLPSLFKSAADFQDETKRHAATFALSNVDLQQRMKEKFLIHTIDDSLAKRWLGRTFGLRYGNYPSKRFRGSANNAKLRIGMLMEDHTYKSLITDVEASVFKEYGKWHWDGIIELMQGPLQIAKRLDDVVRNMKFFKRLLHFYRPRSQLFAEIKRGKGSFKYIKAGCEMIQLLVTSIEGMRILIESRILQEIANCLTEVDPFEERPDLVFSQDRVEKTLVSEYFTFLGILMKSDEGIRLLERCRVFTTLFHVSELHNRDDLVKAMITNMIYNEGHPRIILFKVMTSGSKNMRIFATNHLRFLLRTNSSGVTDWGIHCLITQLYDPIYEVCNCAVDVLDEAFNEPKNVDAAVELRPTLVLLRERGNPIILRFLSTSSGYRLLEELGYVEEDLAFWREYGIYHYVTKVEVNFAKLIYRDQFASGSGYAPPMNDSFFSKASDDPFTFEMDNLNSVGPHFYGELVKTKEGCALLSESGHFTHFVDILRQGLDDSNPAFIKKLKGVLWAVGHIGSSEMGLPFLMTDAVVEDIANLAENSTVLSIKGTCYFVLGLISCTHPGAEVLSRYGWETVARTDGKFDGLCVPRNPSRFLGLPEWRYKGSWPEKRIKLHYLVKSDDADPVHQEIFKLIGNMSNHILANQASKSLSKLRFEHPQYFNSMESYIKVQRMFSTYHYRLTTRRFIQDLFDRVSFNEKGLTKIDEMKGLLHEIKGFHEVEHGTEDDLSEMLMNSAMYSTGRRGMATGAIAAVKLNCKTAKDEKSVFKPARIIKGFI